MAMVLHQNQMVGFTEIPKGEKIPNVYSLYGWEILSEEMMGFFRHN